MYAIQITGGTTGAKFVLDRLYATRPEAERVVGKIEEFPGLFSRNKKEVVEVSK